MNRFASGFLAGSAIGMVGLMVAMKDRRARKSMIREGKKAIAKANNMANNISEMF